MDALGSFVLAVATKRLLVGVAADAAIADLLSGGAAGLRKPGVKLRKVLPHDVYRFWAYV